MRPGGRIVWIERQRPFDQAGRLDAVALFQPEHAQQIQRRENARIDFQNLAIKPFSLRRFALLMQRDGLASQDMHVPGFHRRSVLAP